MEILIIEDEAQAAWILKDAILRIQPNVQIIGTLDSIVSIEEWFINHPSPDLIFSDIQLADGLVFEALKKVTLQCPVIFCTAYDEYLLQAFKSNGIDYLLKPLDEKELSKSFEKFHMLGNSPKARYDKNILEKMIHEILGQKKSYKTHFLVAFRDSLIPVETSDINYFKATASSSELELKEGGKYHYAFTLDYLMTVLDPASFFRANRQYIVAFQAIQKIEHVEERKLLVHLKLPCKEHIIVSKAKASEFLQWVQNR